RPCVRIGFRELRRDGGQDGRSRRRRDSRRTGHDHAGTSGRTGADRRAEKAAIRRTCRRPSVALRSPPGRIGRSGPGRGSRGLSSGPGTAHFRPGGFPADRRTDRPPGSRNCRVRAADRRPLAEQTVRAEAMTKIPLVFLAGMGRSGSTLLERLLDGLPGWWSMGEVLQIWERGATANEKCGCGEAFLDCPVWTAVGEKAFGGWDAIEVDRVAALRRSVERDRYIPLLYRPTLNPAFNSRLKEYNRILSRLYQAVRETT